MDTNIQTNKSQAIVQNEVTTNLLMRHLNSFLVHDLESLVSDYTDKSVFMTKDATYTGKKEIQQFFTSLLTHFPKEQYQFELDKMEVNDRLGFIIWHAVTPSLLIPFGTDTFIIDDEKIIQQTFAGQLNFITR
jgi:hypothetical protein